jgi:hypothetical protein
MTPPPDVDAVALLVAQLAPNAPWLLLGALALRSISTWTRHLCELTPRVLDILDRVSRDGMRVRVEVVERPDVAPPHVDTPNKS